VAEKGFTDRQAGFLVTVMLHSGVCIGRQYCVYARIVRGQKVYDFFASLVARRFATSYAAAHRRDHIYHLHSKLLYAAIGEPNDRNRKPVTLARAVERLMVLDLVRAESRLRWLGSGREKMEYFKAATTLRLRELPHLAFGRGAERPFGTSQTSCRSASPQTAAHTYSCTSSTVPRPSTSVPSHRQPELLRALPEWELRLLVPRHMVKAPAMRMRLARR
jgi:hypothetical protein